MHDAERLGVGADDDDPALSWPHAHARWNTSRTIDRSTITITSAIPPVSSSHRREACAPMEIATSPVHSTARDDRVQQAGNSAAKLLTAAAVYSL